MAETSVATRSSTIRPIIGQSKADVPSGGLPTGEQILQVNSPSLETAPTTATAFVGGSPLQGGSKEQKPECAVLLLP